MSITSTYLSAVFWFARTTALAGDSCLKSGGDWGIDVSVGDGFSITVPKFLKLYCLNGLGRNKIFPSSELVDNEIRILSVSLLGEAGAYEKYEMKIFQNRFLSLLKTTIRQCIT